VTPGRKDPPLVRFSRAATADPCAVADFWREHPVANIGVRTGDGMIVLDLDFYKPESARLGLEVPHKHSVQLVAGGIPWSDTRRRVGGRILDKP
jgi:hypothetical protein